MRTAESSPARSPRADAVFLAGTSFLILYLELAFIRYLPAQVKFFSYYTNFVLLAAFLGGGVGLLLAHRARGLQLGWPVAVALLFVAVFLLRNVVVRQPGGAEFLWGVYGEPSPRALILGLAPTVLILFTLLVAVFVPLGARLGEVFGRFPPLSAYGLDIGGALAGVLAFALVSGWGLSPAVWFGIAFALYLAVCGTGWLVRMAGLAVGGLALGLVLKAAGPGERWSPYYRIDVYPNAWFGQDMVAVNGSMHQLIVNFADTASSAAVRRIWADYRSPYAFAETVDTVLVVGAGAGNDVSLLLSLGARYIDAVEIDPDILVLGLQRNPALPYADRRVRLHVDDARAFFRKTSRRYDLIVFGTLDSQTRLSGMTTLRLDNYVYTTEAMQDARARLKPGGRLITYHMSPFPYIAARIYQNLYRAFGTPVLALHISPHVLFNMVFLAGASRQAVAGHAVPEWLLEPTRLPTDDWPYLYLQRATIPRHYAVALAGVLALALLAVGGSVRGGARRDFDAPMFFMGAGFLLIETKSVTEMALLFGSTWTVNVLVFSAVLAVILAANVLVQMRVRPSLDVLFVGLFVALGLGAAVPIRALSGLGLPLAWTLGSILVALPVLFAALIFPRFLETRTEAARALGWNVLGAIVGGAAEYSSMLWGIKALYLVAALAYGGVLLASRGGRGSHSVTAVTDVA